MNKDKKTLVVSFLVLGLSVGLVVIGGYIKYVGAVPGSETGLGESAGQALYNMRVLYDVQPREYGIGSPFAVAGVMGPYAGTISSLNDFVENGTIAYGSFYYGYNWCTTYSDDAVSDCNGGQMPLCVILWTPAAVNGTGDNSYQACYTMSGGGTQGQKAWRASKDANDDTRSMGRSQVRDLRVLTADPGKTGLSAIDDRQ